MPVGVQVDRVDDVYRPRGGRSSVALRSFIQAFDGSRISFKINSLAFGWVTLLVEWRFNFWIFWVSWTKLSFLSERWRHLSNLSSVKFHDHVFCLHFRCSTLVYCTEFFRYRICDSVAVLSFKAQGAGTTRLRCEPMGSHVLGAFFFWLHAGLSGGIGMFFLTFFTDPSSREAKHDVCLFVCVLWNSGRLWVGVSAVEFKST